MKPPKWYNADEIKEWLVRKGSRISKENAAWLADEFQKAFEKGWEKSHVARRDNRKDDMTTKIEWTRGDDGKPGESWNPAPGCTKISEGCQNCYAALMAATRLKQNPKYKGLAYFKDGRGHWTGEIRMDSSELDRPMHWKKPRRILVPSMGDLGHEAVSPDFFHKVLQTIFNCPQHTFMMLTKRPKAIARGLSSYYEHFNLLPNLWVGVSAENQKRLEERMKHFVPIPAVVKFISYEPALDWIFIGEYAMFIDWVIAGSESGNGRRRSSRSRFRQARDDCELHGIPFFLKQMDIKGRLVKMPELDGIIYDQRPRP